MSAPGSGIEAIRAAVSDELAARLPAHAERLGWSPEELAAHQCERLRGLLGIAIERSPFHARRLAGVDPATFELADLERLPVMTKAEMMEAYDELVTDRRLTREAVEAHIDASTEEPSLLEGEFVCLASGGSSGERGVFAHGFAEYADFGASVMRRGWARLTAIGGPPPGGVLVGVVAASAPIHSTGLASAVVTEGPFRFTGAPATAPLDEIVATLNEAAPAMLMGYPSKLAELAGERRAGRLAITPLGITSTSEALTAATREAIEAGFGAPVVDQFASTEGLVGHTDPGGSVLEFASDMCIAELVDEEGHPVATGEPSAKVLVTNLFNLTQPLIRYELTDRFTAEPGEGWLRATVEGRADEVFRYGHTVVHPHALRSPLVAAGVHEHRVRQTAAGVEAEVVADATVDERELAEALERALRAAGLAEARATVTAVDRIDRDAVTGKARRFIPLAPG